MNSDNETGRKESRKAGDTPDKPGVKVVGKAKVARPASKRKPLKQKGKSSKRRKSTS